MDVVLNNPIRVRLGGGKIPIWRHNETTLSAKRFSNYSASVIPLGNSTRHTLETHYFPLYCGTAFFAIIFIIVPFFIKGPDRWIYKSCVMLAAFSMWILWATIYIAQMNPIIGPRVTNETLVWIAYRWGDPMMTVASRSIDEVTYNPVINQTVSVSNPLPPNNSGAEFDSIDKTH